MPVSPLAAKRPSPTKTPTKGKARGGPRADSHSPAEVKAAPKGRTGRTPKRKLFEDFVEGGEDGAPEVRAQYRYHEYHYPYHRYYL